MSANNTGVENKLKSTYEGMRIDWRLKNNPTDLLCPLHRIAESTKLLWVLGSMETALGLLKQKDFTNKIFNKNYDESEAKIKCLVEVSEYHFLLFELAYQNNLAAFRAEQRLSTIMFENEKLKKEIEKLNKEKQF